MEKSLTVINQNLPEYMRQDAELARKAFEETKAASDPRLSNIKIAPGGVNLFMRGEESLKEIEGIVLAVARAYALWIPKDNPDAFYKLFSSDFHPEASDVPLCSSIDGFTGTHTVVPINGKQVFGDCHKCHFNSFGSDFKGGKGKACKNGKRLLILLRGSSIPNILTLPPTSIRAWDEYVAHLINQRLIPHIVYTKIGLEKKSNENGQPYSVCRFDMPAEPRYLSQDDFELMKQFKAEFERMIKTDIRPEEFGGESPDPNGQVETEATVVDPATEEQLGLINRLMNYKDFSQHGELRAEILNFISEPNDKDKAAGFIAAMQTLPDARKKKSV